MYSERSDESRTSCNGLPGRGWTHTTHTRIRTPTDQGGKLAPLVARNMRPRENSGSDLGPVPSIVSRTLIAFLQCSVLVQFVRWRPPSGGRGDPTAPGPSGLRG